MVQPISPEYLKRARNVTNRYDVIWFCRNKRTAIEKIISETNEAEAAETNIETLEELSDVLLVTLAGMHAIGVTDKNINHILEKTMKKAEKRVSGKEVEYENNQFKSLANQIMRENGGRYFGQTSAFREQLIRHAKILTEITGKKVDIPKTILALEKRMRGLDETFLKNEIKVTIQKNDSGAKKKKSDSSYILLEHIV